MNPIFSIIIPTFNRKSLVIKCVKALLDQNFSKINYEIIVVDNNSSDGTVEALKDFPIKLLVEKKQGSYSARNKGISQAKGSWIVFIDDDCLAQKDMLVNFQKFTSDSKIGALAGKIIQLNTHTFLDDWLKRTRIVNQKMALNHPYLPFALTANVSYQKEIFDKIGLFDDTFSNGGDIDFSWRMQIQTGLKIKYIPQAIVYHQPRETFKKFLKQVYFYGYGEKMLENKFKLSSNTPQRIKRTFGYLILSLPRFIFYKVLKSFGFKYKYCPEIAFLDFFYNASYLLGRFRRN